MPEIVPVGSGHYTCPTRQDVLNTKRSERWRIWDDAGSGCRGGCFLKWCGNGTIAPCCVKRQTARWSREKSNFRTD